jgi:hypothetical protein
MAILWWIGATANGDVNVAGNWSYLGPFAYPMGYTALVPATNIPKYSDTLIFDKFTPGGNVYPLYSPIGSMRGICGPVGNTAAQWFQEVRVFPDCPKPLGGSTAFAFRTSSLLIKRGITGNLPNNYSTSHLIHLYDCGGVTKTQANILIDSQIRENYILTGVAGQLKVGVPVGPSIGRDPYSIIFLNNMELQGKTFTSTQYPDPIILNKQNAAIESRETVVTGTNAETNQAQVFIRLYPTTTITNNIYLQGREKLVVYRGFNLTTNSIYLDSGASTSDHAQIEFVSDESSSLTGTGGTEAVYSTRSYIYELNMYGSSNPVYQILLPKAELNHGVDINTLNFNGSGQVTTTNQQLGDAARILRGSINFPNIGNPDNPNGNEKMGIYSDIDNISFGPSGRFIFDNTGSFNTVPSVLRFNLRGNWAYKITPIFED